MEVSYIFAQSKQKSIQMLGLQSHSRTTLRHLITYQRTTMKHLISCAPLVKILFQFLVLTVEAFQKSELVVSLDIKEKILSYYCICLLL